MEAVAPSVGSRAMKKRNQLLLVIVLLAGLFVFGVWFQAHRLLPSPKVREDLVQKIQTITDGTLSYQGFQVGYFPQPRLIFERPQLAFSNQPLVIEAEELRFDFNILALLLDRAEASAMDVIKGKMDISIPLFSFVNPVKLENFSFQMGAFRPNIPIPVHFVSDISGKRGVLLVKGHITIDSAEKWSWEKASGHLVVALEGLSLKEESAKRANDPQSFFFFKEGQVNTGIEIRKKPRELFLEFTATGGGLGLAYEMKQDKTWTSSPSFDADWDVAGAWNNDTEELKLHKIKLKIPVGHIEANGNFKLLTGEIAGIHVKVLEMGLEDLLKYWPGFEKALPFHIGFSGPCKWVMSAEGTMDHLSLHFNWDLTQVLLTYGEYFSKPKDVPLDITFDCLVQKSEMLSGDFSVKFEDMTLKGSLADLDIAQGNGQLSLLTNKFSVTGWEKYIPAIQNYKLEGAAKLLANWKGDVRKVEQAERIFNITLEKGSWTTLDGQGIRNATLVFDSSPLMMEGRQMKFDIGNSPMLVDLKISGINEKPQTDIKVMSGELKPQEVWQAVTALFRHKQADAGPDIYDHVKKSIEALFPQNNPIRDFSVEAHLQDKLWDVPALKFLSYEGQVALKGLMDVNDKELHYHVEGEVLGLNMGLFLGRAEEGQKLLDGTLTFKGSLQGTGWGKQAWAKSLTGQGELTLANGRFQTFDLKDTLAVIEPFSGIGEIDPGMKDFGNLDLHWQLSGGKMTTNDLLIKSPDYVIDGEGTMDFEGLTNLRFDVFLSTALAARLLPDMASPLKKAKQAHVGPIPVLFSGPFSAPEVKPDPVQVAGLVDKIQRKKTKEILYELILE